MPLVRIEILKGRSPEYKKCLLDCVHEGLAEAFGTEEWDRFQRVAEYDREDFETAPDKTDDFVIIELTIFPGRSAERKRAAIEGITSLLGERLSIKPSDIFIIMHEPPLENWGLGGHQKG